LFFVKTAKLFLLLGFVSGAGGIFGCAPAVIQTTALIPAKSHEASLLKVVAVLPFEGDGGENFAAEVEAELAAVNIGDKQYFTIVDRAKITKVLDEETTLAQSGFADPSTVAKIGGMLGAKGVYTGVITASHANDSNYTDVRKDCVQHIVRYTEKGSAYKGECISWSHYTVPCTKRTVVFAFAPKLIEVETGRIVYAGNYEEKQSSLACSDSSTPIHGSYELLGEAKQFALNRFRQDVAPHYVTFNISIMDSTDGITSKQAINKFKDGLAFAKNNRFDRACELWGEARIITEGSVSLIYNLGACSEISGEYEQALDLYEKADRLYNKPDDMITSALQRVANTLGQQKKLKEQIQ
ncbi:MAG: hypothetical protein AAB356_09315, partial [Deltaproteobacteria bacterium]